MGLSRDEIVSGYRYLLGRKPDADEIAVWSSEAASPEGLRAHLLATEEYRRTAPDFLARLRDGYTAMPRPIETKVDSITQRRLFDRVRRQWQALGQSDPYWSVLTVDRYRADRITPRMIDHFYASGRLAADLIGLAETRIGNMLPRGTCVELGCGVGRLTLHLAAMFEKVIAIDISEGNLAIARNRLADLANVEFVHMTDMAEVSSLPDHDMFYSMIALQHNPPPVQAYILDMLLARTNPGGACLFQTVTDLPGYGFSVAEYLAGPDAQMEVHALPQSVIFDLLARHRLRIRHVAMDPWLDSYGSNSFLAIKAPTNA